MPECVCLRMYVQSERSREDDECDGDGDGENGSLEALRQPKQAGLANWIFENNKQTANGNLPCTPFVTRKDARPRFCNPSSLSSHSLICSLTPTHTEVHGRIRRQAEEQICTPTPTHLRAKK